MALYGAGALVFFLWARPRGPFAGMDAESRRRWVRALVFLVIVHMLVRSWMFTGSAPLPSDDACAGYKANALINSPSWPTVFPEAPELALAYYYYAFSWPAALASWVHLPVPSGWWVTAIVLCAMGGMLVLELILPRLRSGRDFLVALVVVTAGCDVSYLPSLAYGLGPKNWYREGGFIGRLGDHFGLYLRVPQFVCYQNSNGPFAGFEAGLLVVAVVLLWRLITDGKAKGAESIFVGLVIASLAGYCTFDLIGFVLVIAPVLCGAAIAVQGGGALRRWFVPLAAMGAGSLALCLPIVMSLAHRSREIRLDRFRDPLLIWLRTGLPHAGYGVFAMLVVAFVLAAGISNVALLPVMFRGGKEPLPAFTKLLLWMFWFGTFVCLFGVTDDFVGKFGWFLSMVAILAFFTIEKPPKWSRVLLVCGVIGPGLAILNCVRANIVMEKFNPAWATLDQLEAQRHEVVVYDVPDAERRRRGPLEILIPYFSRIEFVAPVEQINEQGQDYMMDPSQLKTLPPTAERVRALAKGSPTYLLLRLSSTAPEGERVYSDRIFSIDRVKVE
jgi:hypothetical protein